MIGRTVASPQQNDGIGIRWFDQASHTVHYLYEMEQGRRLQITPKVHGPAQVLPGSQELSA